MEQPASSALAVEKQIKPEEFKPLQSAQITWNLDEYDNNYVVRTSAGEKLFQLPKKLTDLEAMAILKAVRPFELQAFEDGKRTGMDAMKAATRDQMIQMDMTISILKRQNEELSEALDRAIGG
jgi:hypothetical protein